MTQSLRDLVGCLAPVAWTGGVVGCGQPTTEERRVLCLRCVAVCHHAEKLDKAAQVLHRRDFTLHEDTDALELVELLCARLDSQPDLPTQLRARVGCGASTGTMLPLCSSEHLCVPCAGIELAADTLNLRDREKPPSPPAPPPDDLAVRLRNQMGCDRAVDETDPDGDLCGYRPQLGDDPMLCVDCKNLERAAELIEVGHEPLALTRNTLIISLRAQLKDRDADTLALAKMREAMQQVIDRGTYD